MGTVWAQLLAALESFRALPGVEKAAWVQAAAAVAGAVVTAAYVVLTYVQIHAPHRAYVRPVGTVIEGDHDWLLVVRNLGPGLATQVEVRCMQVRKMALDPREGRRLKAWVDLKQIPLKGPHEIKPRGEARYAIGFMTQFKYPVFISWRTVTGRRQTSSWQVTLDRQDEVVKLGLRELWSYHRDRLKAELRSPLVRLDQWWTLRQHPEEAASKERDDEQNEG